METTLTPDLRADTGASVPTGAAAPQADPLTRLDDALVEVRRVLQRPGYRRAVLGGSVGSLELATLRVLRVVQRAEEAPSIGAVAEVLAVDPSTASRLVERAVDAGLLERRSCDQDRRRARLHLTPEGAGVLDAVSVRRLGVLAEATDGWSEEDLTALLGLLERLLDGFDTLEGRS